MMNKLSTALVAMSLVAVAQSASVQAGDKILIKPSTTVKRCDTSIVTKKPDSVEDATRGVYGEPPEGLDCNFQELKRGPVLVTQPKPSKSNQAFIKMLKDKEAKAKADAEAAAAKKP